MCGTARSGSTFYRCCPSCQRCATAGCAQGSACMQSRISDSYLWAEDLVHRLVWPGSAVFAVKLVWAEGKDGVTPRQTFHFASRADATPNCCCADCIPLVSICRRAPRRRHRLRRPAAAAPHSACRCYQGACALSHTRHRRMQASVTHTCHHAVLSDADMVNGKQQK